MRQQNLSAEMKGNILKPSPEYLKNITEENKINPSVFSKLKRKADQVFTKDGSLAFNPSAKSLKLPTYKELDDIVLDWLLYQ